MKGFELDDPSQRTPVNVAIVLDKSGSMRGQKIVKAKEAAIMAIQRLRPDDIVSVVMYDHTVKVVVPATKVSDREAIYAAIRRVTAGGNTALFGGVSKGAHEIRKFLDDRRVNRIILLSDGLANTGPSSPGDLAALGDSLGREGISVTTVGLGLDYNEDLMTALADESDGNHYFAEEVQDLQTAFTREFGDVLSVVAQEVAVSVRCAPGVRPVRTLGRDAGIDGQTVATSLNQLYSEQMKYLLLEVELPPQAAGAEMMVATVGVSYANMATKTTDKLESTVSVRASDDPAAVKVKVNAEVMAAAAHQIGADQNRLAVRLRDEGKVEEAREVLIRNAEELARKAEELGSKELDDYSKTNSSAVVSWFDEGLWNQKRKTMRKEQQQIKSQQAVH